MSKLLESISPSLKPNAAGFSIPPGFVDRLKLCLGVSTVIRENESLARFTTLRVGGAADIFLEPTSENELAAIVRCCLNEGVPTTILGRGSNLLIRDGGIRGVVIRLFQGSFISLRDDGECLHSGPGVRLKKLAHFAREKGIGGLEFFEGIPGSLGGALRMNAGAMGKSTFDVLTHVRAMNSEGIICDYRAEEIPATYRSCPFFDTHIALGAELKGVMDAPSTIKKRMEDYSSRRWATQPAAPSAGCIFKNPDSIPAGKLVEVLGLKGLCYGGAAVSEVHGNFIVNNGQARASDILHLIALIQEKALEEKGIHLETEVTIIGEERAS